MQTVHVAAGVVFDAQGKVLICRRKGALEGLWEFPGGKQESGETIEACLQRELMEELALSVTVESQYDEVTVSGDDRLLILHFLKARLTEDSALRLSVHGLAQWVLPQDLGKYAFCPADAEFLQRGYLQGVKTE